MFVCVCGAQAAAACLQRVRDLNPLVTVSVCEGAVDTLSDEALAAYTLVCVASTSLPALTALDDRCRRVGVRFIASCSAGLNAFAFFDLATHTFTKWGAGCLCAVLCCACCAMLCVCVCGVFVHVCRSQTKSDGAVSVESVVLEYPSLTHALSVKLGSIKRFPPLLAALLAAAADPTLPAAKEFLAARAVDASDAVITCVAHHPLSPAATSLAGMCVCVCRGAIGSWGHVVSPVAGILGGIIGQEIVKAISLKDEPIHNFFLFDGDTCFGTINTIV